MTVSMGETKIEITGEAERKMTVYAGRDSRGPWLYFRTTGDLDNEFGSIDIRRADALCLRDLLNRFIDNTKDG